MSLLGSLTASMPSSKPNLVLEVTSVTFVTEFVVEGDENDHFLDDAMLCTTVWRNCCYGLCLRCLRESMS